MIGLIIFIVSAIVLVAFLAVVFADGAKAKRESKLRAAVELRGVERRTDVAHTKQAMRQEAGRVRRELAAELRRLDKGKS